MKITISNPREIYKSGMINHYISGEHYIEEKTQYEPGELTPYMVGMMVRLGWVKIEESND